MALDIYQEIQRHGWPLVEALRTLRLSVQEAEALLIRLSWLTDNIPQMLQAWQGTTSKKSLAATQTMEL